MIGLERLRDGVLAEGGLLAGMLSDEPQVGVFDELANAGPRATDRPTEYALVLESILEGYLLHHGSPRLFQPPDRDMRLLGGDHLYAYGLAELTALGDLAAVRVLADLITDCSRATLESPDGLRQGELWCLATAKILCDAGEAGFVRYDDPPTGEGVSTCGCSDELGRLRLQLGDLLS
jgi:hypothetical protein